MYGEYAQYHPITYQTPININIVSYYLSLSWQTLWKPHMLQTLETSYVKEIYFMCHYNWCSFKQAQNHELQVTEVEKFGWSKIRSVAGFQELSIKLFQTKFFI